MAFNILAGVLFENMLTLGDVRLRLVKFPDDELAGQGDELQALEPHARRTVEVARGVAAYHVVSQGVLVHQAAESRFYA